MKLAALLLICCIPLIAFGQDTVHYKIYNTRTQKTASVAEIVNELAKADVLFFGEEHNDSTSHQLEYLLLQKIEAKYPSQTALSMEMFETDCQNVLDEYLKGLIREKNFKTDARAWPNYKDYRPLIEFSKDNNIPVIAANAPARYTNMVNRLGLESLEKLSALGKSYLPPLPVDTATGAYYEKFKNIMGGHASMPGMQLYQAQNLWDATMGWSIACFLKDHHSYKILQLNGNFHSEEKLGIPAQLLHYDHKARILSIALYSDENFTNPDWTKFSKMGDYIILTDPALPRTF